MTIMPNNQRRITSLDRIQETDSSVEYRDLIRRDKASHSRYNRGA